ncbi:MAG: flagellar hook-length control protein FliK [Armatimonadota bacterium]
MDPTILLFAATQSSQATSPCEARVSTPQGGEGDFLGFLRQFGGQVDPELFRKVFSTTSAAAMQSPFPRVNPMPLPVMPVVDGKLADGTAALKTPASPVAASVELGTSPKGDRSVVERKLKKGQEVAPEVLLMTLPVALVAVAQHQQAHGDTPPILAEPETTEAAPESQPDLPAVQAAAQALAMLTQPAHGRANAAPRVEDGEEPVVDGEPEGEAAEDAIGMELKTEAGATDGLPQLPAPPVPIAQVEKPHPEMPEAAVIHAKSQASDRAQAMMPAAVREAVVKERPVEHIELPLPVTDGEDTQVALTNVKQNQGLHRGHDKHEKNITAEVAVVSNTEAAAAIASGAGNREVRTVAPDARLEALTRHFAEAGIRMVHEPAPDAQMQGQTGGQAGDHPRFAFADHNDVELAATRGTLETKAFDRLDAEETVDSADRVSTDVMARSVEAPKDGVRPVAQSHEARVAAVEPQRVIDRIVTAVRMEVHGARQELVVRLDPPELGTLHIKVSSGAGGGMTVQVEATAPWVRDMLDTRLQELRRSFTDLGINVEQCGVSMHMETNAQQASDGQPGMTHRQGAQTPRFDQDLTTPVEAEPVRARREHSGVLDMLA